ncbi:MAG: TIGR02206 family membrane protein [Verrucomicrobiota bacterium]
MDWEHFHPFSWLHFTALGVCVALPLGLVLLSSRIRRDDSTLSKGRFFLVMGNLGIWLIACGFWFHPTYFRLEQSLPLQYCNIANLIAAVAIGFKWRPAQSLLYFWTFALCIWAFLTPFLMVGPSHPWFWVFWLYHLFIPMATAWVLSVDGFRPSRSDLGISILATTIYTLFLAGLNALTGWNYGFVGPGKPGQPSLIDALGDYPERLIWMFFIAAGLFVFLYLPWHRPKDR